MSGSERLGSNWNVAPPLNLTTSTSGSSAAVASVSVNPAVQAVPVPLTRTSIRGSTAVAIALFITVTVSSGVFAGANIAYQESTSKSFKPVASATVGTSGRIEVRFWVVTASGRLDAIYSTAFANQVGKLITGTNPKILIDFTNIDFVTSAGLRAVLVLIKKAKASGGAFALCGLNDQVREVLDISGFADMFSTHPGRAEGVAALRG